MKLCTAKTSLFVYQTHANHISEIKVKVTENLEYNIRDQTGEHILYYHWSSSNLSGKNNLQFLNFLIQCSQENISVISKIISLLSSFLF